MHSKLSAKYLWEKCTVHKRLTDRVELTKKKTSPVRVVHFLRKRPLKTTVEIEFGDEICDQKLIIRVSLILKRLNKMHLEIFRKFLTVPKKNRKMGPFRLVRFCMLR